MVSYGRYHMVNIVVGSLGILWFEVLWLVSYDWVSYGLYLMVGISCLGYNHWYNLIYMASYGWYLIGMVWLVSNGWYGMVWHGI